MTMSEGSGGTATSPQAEMDFSQFGEVDAVPLPRLKRISGRRLAHSWRTIPHVTHHDDADITDLEVRRKAIEASGGARVSVLAALMKASAMALTTFPHFNASLSDDQTTLILKRYVHLGLAIETPRGLLVGVVRDCDSKPAAQIAEEAATLAQKARDKGLNLAEMSGGCFTISSLGGIGGGAFSPIINAPELAILGVGRAEERARRGPAGDIDWRRCLPLSLSYDHRVIDGADAARFVRFLGQTLGDGTFLESL